MPRTYVRKNVRALWSEEDLRKAIDDLQNGRGSVREISRLYKVPARTLMRRKDSGNLSKEKLGRKSCLTSDHEASLVNYIQNMEKHGFALTSVAVKKIAFSFVDRNNIPNTFNADKKQAGHDWFVSFMQRHPQLSIRKAEKRNKKQIKEQKESAKLKRKQDNMKKKEANKENRGKKKTFTYQKRRRNANAADTSSSDSELEVATIESDDSELEYDESEFCAACGGYYFDKKGPKCDWLQCVKCYDWIHETCTPSNLYCEDCVPLNQLLSTFKALEA